MDSSASMASCGCWTGEECGNFSPISPEMLEKSPVSLLATKNLEELCGTLLLVSFFMSLGFSACEVGWGLV